MAASDRGHFAFGEYNHRKRQIMKPSKTARKSVAGTDVYRDFMHLDRERRRRIAMRILRNQGLLVGLHDHFLIQGSLAEPQGNLARAGGVSSAQGKPTLIFDTSAVNRLADDCDRGRLEAGVRAGLWFRLAGDTLGEVVATPDTVRRKLLLNLCKRLLSAGDCLLPHDEVLKGLIQQHAKNSSFDWETVPVRCEEFERELALQEIIDDKIAREQSRFACEVGNGFAKIYEDAGPRFKKLFRRHGAAPLGLGELVEALQVPGGAFWSMATGFYRRPTGETINEGAARAFVDTCPPFRALLMALCVAQHQRSIQNPRHKSTGVFDLYASVYLPYCREFVTADPGQLEALLNVVSLAKLAVRVRSYTDFRAALVGLA